MRERSEERELWRKEGRKRRRQAERKNPSERELEKEKERNECEMFVHFSSFSRRVPFFHNRLRLTCIPRRNEETDPKTYIKSIVNWTQQIKGYKHERIQMRAKSHLFFPLRCNDNTIITIFFYYYIAFYFHHFVGILFSLLFLSWFLFRRLFCVRR